MIQVNGRNFTWEDGLTVQRLIELKRYIYPHKIVRINDRIIQEEEYGSTLISSGDDVKVIHLMAGG
ncbi:MAG: sulfur carrier protein ThiS [Spirochaetales bacterium]|nr:sulfur carrier protein ThiS [Spirochaetales bacterium]